MPTTEAQLHDQLVHEGLRPTRWSNDPQFVYGVHDHPYGKVLVVVSGSITFTVGPAIAPRPSAVGGTVEQEHSGGRDVAPIGAGVPVPRAVPVGLHGTRVVRMQPGDRLTLDPRAPHSAVVGPDGVVCLEAHTD